MTFLIIKVMARDGCMGILMQLRFTWQIIYLIVSYSINGIIYGMIIVLSEIKIDSNS